MKSTVSAILLLLTSVATSVSALDISKPLPNWLDSNEQPKASRFVAPTRATPSDFRIPAEYEPAKAVVVGWAGYTSMLTGIAKAVSGPGKAQIWAVGGPASISGVTNYSAIKLPINSVWMRDYGPFGVSAGTGKAGIVDSTYRHYQYRPDDDALPSNLARVKGFPAYGMKIILDGGNLMVDSYGNLFMTKRTYIWNSNMSQAAVDAELKANLHVKNIYTFEYSGYPGEPADGTGHIDMFMKLLNDHTVLLAVAETEPYKSNTEKAMAFFKGRTAPDGKPYEIVTAKGWADNGAWYTYTNSLIVNKVAIIPSYTGHAADEAVAVAAYKKGIAGGTVVPVNSDDSITAGGSIHCTTQLIPELPGTTRGAADLVVPVEYQDSSDTLGGILKTLPSLNQVNGAF